MPAGGRAYEYQRLVSTAILELEQLEQSAMLLDPGLLKLGIAAQVQTDEKGSRLATMLVLEGVPASADPPPPGRYTIANGTVYGTKTKVTWQQEPPANNMATFAGAKTYCAGLSLNGAAPWRVPTNKELLTIVDLNPPFDIRGMAYLDATAFLNAALDVYWSSTPTPQGANEALGVDFSNGRLVNQGATAMNYVRCVR